VSLIPRGSEVLTPELPAVEELIREAEASSKAYLAGIAARGRGPRVLFINTGHFGDILVSLPFMQLAKKRYPNAHVGALVARPADDLFRRGGWFDELFVLPSYALKANKPGMLTKQFAAIWQVIKRDWDLVVTVAPDPEDRLISALTRAPVRVGPVKHHNWIYSRGWTTVSLPWAVEHIHVNIRFGQATRSAGLGEPEFPQAPLRSLVLNATEQANVDAFVASTGDASKPLVTMMVCGSNKIRRWPIPCYAEAARYARERHGARVAIVTGPGERDALPEIEELLLKTGLATHFRERPLMELVGLVRASKAVIASDSGPAHVAASSGANTVYLVMAFMASTWVPWGPHIRGVLGEQVRDIPATAVCAALDDFMLRRRSPPTVITPPTPPPH